MEAPKTFLQRKVPSLKTVANIYILRCKIYKPIEVLPSIILHVMLDDIPILHKYIDNLKLNQ